MNIEDLQESFKRINLKEISDSIAMAAPVTREEFDKLQEQLRQLTTKQRECSNSVIIEKDPPPSHGKGLKPTKLPEYHGDRSTYPSWRTAVLDIFRMDWNTFGYDDSRAFVMIYGALKGAALKRAGPFYEAGGINGTRKPEDFIEFLDRLNLDPLRVARANTELHAMKMREGQRWPDFFAAWCNKLTEARGDFWDDRNKTSMLQAALSDELIKTMAGNHLIPDDNFDEFVRIVNQVAQQLEMVDARRKGNQNRQFQSHKSNQESVTCIDSKPETFNKKGSFKESLGLVGQLDSSGDTIMGGINSAGISHGPQRRAKWKTQAQIDRLRNEGRCFRCERIGCVSQRCPLLPARNPYKKTPKINSIVLEEIDPSVYEEEGVQTSSKKENLAEN